MENNSTSNEQSETRVITGCDEYTPYPSVVTRN